MRRYVANHNTFKAQDVEKFINDGITAVRISDWKNYHERVRQVVEDEMWVADDVQDDIDPLWKLEHCFSNKL